MPFFLQCMVFERYILSDFFAKFTRQATETFLTKATIWLCLNILYLLIYSKLYASILCWIEDLTVKQWIKHFGVFLESKFYRKVNLLHFKKIL